MFKVGDRVKLICKFNFNALGTVVDVPKHRETGKVGDVYVNRDAAGPTDCLRYHESELELVKPTTTPHKHAALIKAWADGAEIQIQGFNGKWSDIVDPCWNSPTEYRIKPEPKPDVVLYGMEQWIKHQGREIKQAHDTVKFTFDGETGQLKAVELLS